jgi:hypothetical protein
MPQRFTIGRDRACDIAIADDSVSRTHAEVWMEEGTLMLADRGSSNGTEVIRGGQASAIAKAILVADDQVRFGSVTIAVKDIVETIEMKYPGALSNRPAPVMPAGPPPPPPIPLRATPPPPPALPSFPPLPPMVQQPPPLGASSPGAPVGGPLVRCECGAIKTLGQFCPGCHR